MINEESLYNLYEKVINKIFELQSKNISKKKQNTLKAFFTNMVRFIIVLLTGLLVLEVFGFDTGVIITSLGAVTVVIGLAFQDLLKDFIAGISLTFQNSYNVGDTITINGFKGEVISRVRGTIVAFENGTSITYGLYNAQDKGELFIGAGVDVYEGMIVGLNSRSEDLAINVCKEKHLTNTRASGSDEALRLVPPIQMSLEKAIEFIQDDELVEITPKSIRLRKKILDNKERERAARNANKA